ncbi:MAG: hypothetical protein ACW99U_11310 [Candidatus Thorarchaeota archaeon]
MSSVVYIPIEGERILAQGAEYSVTNYRLLQYDHGSRQSVSIPWHTVKEYKLLQRSGMFKVINGIVNVVGTTPRREEVRAAIGLREYDELTVGGQRKICEVAGIPYIHPEDPYNRWSTLGYHRKLSRDFFLRFAWIKGEEVFTYYPDNFILTDYRLYQYDQKQKKLYMFPLHMVHTFESKKNKLKIEASTGKFEIKGVVPRQDQLLRVWKNREWDTIPKEHIDWLAMEYSGIAAHNPLQRHVDTQRVAPMAKAQEQVETVMDASAAPSSSGTVFVKPQIKSACTRCGASLSYEVIDWVGPDQYSCPNCGQTHNVDYVRM